jgi:hypothetical protein
LYGITGLNDAFVIDTPTKQRLCRQDARSAELLKPFLEGKDLKRWRVESRGLWLIYIPKNKIDIDDYPAIREWLLPVPTGAGKARDQTGVVRVAAGAGGLPAHFLPRKSVTRISTKSRIFRSSLPAHYNNKSYLGRQTSRPCSRLNSACVVHPCSMSPPVRGGFHQMRVQYVETAPIPD